MLQILFLNLRNIPAYAGRTPKLQNRSSTKQKHPRIRGENLKTTRRSSISLETSPHTRGERRACNKKQCKDGNIPAYAGRTRQQYLARRSLWKHPRIRGENPRVSAHAAGSLETSPHTRGELDARNTIARHRRNIPAYAGRTSHKETFTQVFEKHPRIRGENKTCFTKIFNFPETSPHTRGEPQSACLG